jgi:tetratricopeptide (TPR) repeat protein
MRAAAVIAFALVLTHAAPGAAAEGPGAASMEEARIRFQRGVQLYHEGSYEAALAEFRKAYQVAPSYRLLYNIGQVQYELHDYVGALKSFRQYLNDGNAEIAADRREQVGAELRKLEGLVAYVDVTANPPGADVLIDDVSVGIAPLSGPVVVNAGQRRVTASKAGQVAPVRTITVAGGERVQLVVQVPAPAPLPVRVLPSVPLRFTEREHQSPPQVGMWIGVAATSMLALATGGFAFATQQAKRNFDAEIDSYPSSPERIDYFRSRMVNLALVTDLLAAGALAAGGVTVYLAVTHRDEPENRRVRRLALRLSPGGVSLGGGF